MNDSIIKEHYEGVTGYRPSQSRARRTQELIADLPKGSRILDIGCGDGTFGASLKDAGMTVHGCDISESAIALAKERLDGATVIDVESDGLSVLGSFDVVIAGEVIEHLFKPDVFLKNIQHILAPAGSLIITTPNFLVFSNRVRMLFGHFEYEKTGFFDEGHIHFFTRPALHKALARAGYEVIAENHVIHPKIPKILGRIFPNLFAFQLVLKVKSNTQSNA